MRIRKLSIAGLLIFLLVSVHGQQEQLSVLLPASEAKFVAASYPKSGPNRITGTWAPTKTDIDGLEANLHQITDLSRKGKYSWMLIEHPDKYFRQYVGVVQSGQKRIYVNAFCGFNNGTLAPKDWRNRLIHISDGGNCVWRSLYDNTSKTFLELSINGLA